MRNVDASGGQRLAGVRNGALVDVGKPSATARMRLPAPAENVVSSRNASPGVIA